MSSVSPVARSTAEIRPEPDSQRFGLTVSTRDFDQLTTTLDRIGDAERSAEIVSMTLRIC